jgi:hypothetical protein
LTIELEFEELPLLLAVAATRVVSTAIGDCSLLDPIVFSKLQGVGLALAEALSTADFGL